MTVGRGSAVILGAAAIVLMVVVFHCGVAEAATYTVGDDGGWSFFVSGWPQGKRFEAGDVLVFKYNPSFHNLVKVNEAGYNECTTPSGSKFYRSGKDQIKLVKGQNYFICSIPGHCLAEMKISVNAV
ncbi:basic blue protein-like [Primulina huaijiensis]|uniref:basic blue protein-like n=1 Tax=Primulina huaijiensis TaxID=1492673 RepID=UPI003CC77C0C